MGQIVGTSAKVKRCNLNAIQTNGSQYNTILADGEYMLVCSDNTMTSDGNGNFDYYIVGDGTKTCGTLTLHPIGDIDKQFIEDTSLVIYGKTEINTYGSPGSGNSYATSNASYFGGEFTIEKDGIITNIKGDFIQHGTIDETYKIATAALGTIDQRGKFIIRTTFQFPVVTGTNDVDVSSQNIEAKAGEYLLFRQKNKDFAPRYAYYVGERLMYVSSKTATLDVVMYTNSRRVYYQVVVSTHTESFSEVKQDTDELKSKVEVIEDYITSDKTYVVKDRVTGVPYEITIKNGQIELLPMRFSKCLILGNSLIIHEQTSYWNASNRGMASTKPEYDIAGIIESKLVNVDQTSTVTRVNIASWERNLTTTSSAFETLIGQYIDSSTDLIIIRLGENVNQTDLFKNALCSLIEWLSQQSPNARVLITGMFWTSATKEEAIKEAAKTKGIQYVKINQYDTAAYKEAVGHYTYNEDFTEISEITNSAVALHPSNIGMCAIANAILDSIGYEKSTNTYSLQSVTLSGVTGYVYELDT